MTEHEQQAESQGAAWAPVLMQFWLQAASDPTLGQEADLLLSQSLVPEVGAGTAPDAGRPTTVLTVDARTDLGPLNRTLVGVNWHPGGPPLTVVEPLRPRVARIDAWLQDVSPSPGEVRLGPLLGHVAAVRSIGAEPLVILSYTPAWLGAPNAFGRDPTKVAPADLDAWERLVYDVVYALVTAPAACHRFEAWNEPDIPICWQDTPEAWTATITRTARAIAAVEAETGLDLAFGGPATAFPNPVYLAAFLRPLRDPALPLNFVSWHYYANSPFLGPDGNEFAATEPLHRLLGQGNPLASPASYGSHVRLMRDWTAALLAGAERAAPTLILDEWNLSPGGFDRRHDTHEGAAFAAGVLVELQQTGLEESAYFQLNDEALPADASAYGGHGLVTHDGNLKPTWWSMWLWQQQADRRLAVTGADVLDGLWAQAASDDGRITVLVVSFSASRPEERTLKIAFTGLRWHPASATVRRIDADHMADNAVELVAVDVSGVHLELPAQAVALVEITTTDAGLTAPHTPDDNGHG